MEDKVDAARRALVRDVEAYTCGEIPSAIAMLRAPRLEDWETNVRRVGKEFKLVLYGVVRGHPNHGDGGWVCTSALVWLDRKMRWARSHSRLYVLGPPGGGEIPIDGIET